MTARTTMGTIITNVRALIGDTSGTATYHFSDDEIQAALDIHQQNVKRLELAYIPTPGTAGYTYTDYISPRYFEGSATIQGGTFNTITPSAEDWYNGRITLSASTLPPLYVSGYRYDVYSAAADLCEQWAVEIYDEIDFTADRSSFKRSQRIQNLEQKAANLRSRSETGGVRAVTLYRSDTDR